MARSDFPIHHRIRVRYAETDGQGVVFNSRYLEYADVMVTEYYRAAGVPNQGPDCFHTHVVQALVRYVKPIRFDEEIDGMMRIARIGRSSIASLIELHGAGREDLRAAAELTHVHVDLASGAAIPVPQDIRTRLLRTGRASPAMFS